MALIRILAIFVVVVVPLGIADGDLYAKEGLSWKECLSIAEENDEDYLVAKEQVREAKGRAIEIISAIMPRIVSQGNAIPPIVTARFTQPVSLAVPLSPKIANEAELISEANLKLNYILLVNKIRKEFVKALYEQKKLELQNKRLDLILERKKRAPSLFQAGKITKAEMSSLEVRSNLVKLDILRAEEKTKAALVELADAVGVSFRDSRINKPLYEDIEFLEINLEHSLKQFVETALDKRLDYKILNHYHNIEQARYFVEFDNLLPRGGLYAAGVTSTESLDIFQSLERAMGDSNPEDRESRTDFQAGLNLQWSLYDGGSTYGKLKSSKAVIEKRKIMIDKLRKVIPRQVALTHERLSVASELYRQLKDKKYYEESIELAKQLFSADQISELEVFDVEEAAINLLITILDLKREVELARADFSLAMGLNVKFENEF